MPPCTRRFHNDSRLKGCDQAERSEMDGWNLADSSERSPDIVTELHTELAKLCKGITEHLDQQREMFEVQSRSSFVRIRYHQGHVSAHPQKLNRV